MGSAFFTGCGKRAPIEPAVGMDSPEQTWVRVLLFGNLDQCTIAAPGGFIVEGIDNGVTAEFSDTQPMRLCLENGRIRIGHHRGRSGRDDTFQRPYYFLVDDAGFRGICMCGSLKTAHAFSDQSCAAGVVFVRGNWRRDVQLLEPEALKAQTVAARTYCWRSSIVLGPLVCGM